MNNKKRGFTLIELIIVMAVAAIIMVGALNVFIATTKMQAKEQSYAQAQSSVRLITTQLSKDIRMSSQTLSFATDTNNCTVMTDNATSPAHVYTYCLKGNDFIRNNTTLSDEISDFSLTINGEAVVLKITSPYQGGEYNYEQTIYLRP